MNLPEESYERKPNPPPTGKSCTEWQVRTRGLEKEVKITSEHHQCRGEGYGQLILPQAHPLTWGTMRNHSCKEQEE